MEKTNKGKRSVFPNSLIFLQKTKIAKRKNMKTKMLKFEIVLVFCSFFRFIVVDNSGIGAFLKGFLQERTNVTPVFRQT